MGAYLVLYMNKKSVGDQLWKVHEKLGELCESRKDGSKLASDNAACMAKHREGDQDSGSDTKEGDECMKLAQYVHDGCKIFTVAPQDFVINREKTIESLVSTHMRNRMTQVMKEEESKLSKFYERFREEGYFGYEANNLNGAHPTRKIEQTIELIEACKGGNKDEACVKSYVNWFKYDFVSTFGIFESIWKQHNALPDMRLVEHCPLPVPSLPLPVRGLK